MALLRLHGKIQNYPWGRDGSDSLAALMGANGVADFPGIDESKPYAELWMGTHPNGPATLADEPSKSLSQHLSENRHLLGAAQRFPVVVSEPTDAHVPFLFKILTCKQALPLQIHPSKDLAAKLHEEDPEQFKDVNHKPEIAVAITDFKGFAGFRPIDRTLASIKAVPEVAELFEREASVKGHYAALQSDATPDNLRQLFGAVLALPSSATEATVREVIKRVKADGAEALGDAPDADVLAMVLEKLESQYGSDPAVLVASLFMNLMQLKAGEGAYVPADEAHAWLEGTIVELMAASDNVLNVGFMDDDEKNSVALVTRVLSCTPRPADGFRLETHAWDKASSGKTIAFDTPFEEFAMCQTPRMDVHEEIGPLSGPLIGVVTSDTKSVIELVGGKDAAQTIESGRGTIVFLAAGHKMRVGPGQEFSAAYYDGE